MKEMIKRKWVIVSVVSLTILIVFLAIFFSFIFSYKCDSLECFLKYQSKCQKVIYEKDGEEIVWNFQILGKKDNKCEIKVEIDKIKKGPLSQKDLEGKSMNCYQKIGSLSSPENDISSCTGVLREELQEIIIQKLHKHILENLGTINEDLEKI